MVNKKELELIEGLKKSEESSQSLLIAKYSGLLLKIVMDRGLSRADSHEVVNDTFYKAIKKISTFDASRGTKFTNWLISIAKRTSIDKYRKINKEIATVSLEERAEKGIQVSQEEFESPGDLESKIGLLSTDLLNQALQAISNDDRIILMERAFGQNYRLIAIQLNKTEGAVKVAHHRALKKLKREYINLLESLQNGDAKTSLMTIRHHEDANEQETN